MIYREYEYKANPEIPDRVRNEVIDFRRVNGKYPEKLLLGYGTYLTLCITYTNFHVPGSASSNAVIWLKDWEGVEIVIDPNYEFRVTAISYSDPKEAAITAYVQASK